MFTPVILAIFSLPPVKKINRFQPGNLKIFFILDLHGIKLQNLRYFRPLLFERISVSPCHIIDISVYPLPYHRFCTVKIHEGPKPKIFKLQGSN